ncbi:MAG TPA: HNH endonuclease [Actinocrinis sp.]
MTQPQRDGDEQGSQERQDAAQAIADIVAALQMQRAAVAGVLAQDPAVAPEMLLELARAIDGVVRSSHGLLVQVVARMDEVKAVRGGVATWLTAALGYSPGRARGLASDARRLRGLPEVTEQLACGALPVGAERVLARAAQAAVSTERDAADTVADTLKILQRDGMQAAEREVRYLEHAVQPGKAEQTRTRQRTASFLRLSTCESGMLRLEGLLDIERGTLVRAAIDTLVSTWLRERQYDHAAPVPDDVYSTEQLNAEALFRMAKLLLGASDAQRAERTAGTVLFYGPEPGSTAAPVQESAAQSDSPDSADAAPTPGPALPVVPDGCLETCYGQLVPAAPIVRKSTALHLTLTPTGDPLTLNGQPIDQNPDARLASRAQRIALDFLHRTCTEPGCTRPALWSLHAHHKIPYSAGGPTTLHNMTSLCSQHHVLTHQDDAA